MSKILIDEATVKLALDAMQRIEDADMDCDFLNIRLATKLEEAITALREARAVSLETVGLPESETEEMRDAFAQALTSVYVCGRVWEAWKYGTMSEDDFHPASECEEVLDSLVEAVHGIKESQQ